MDVERKRQELLKAVDASFSALQYVETLALELSPVALPLLIQATFNRGGFSIVTLEPGLDKAVKSAIREFRKLNGSMTGFGHHIPDMCFGFVGISPSVTEDQIRQNIKDNIFTVCVKIQID